MPTVKKNAPKSTKPSQDFVKIFQELGGAFAEIFNDPKLKTKAKELGQTAAESVSTLGDRFHDQEVQHKFKNAGKAAEKFSKSIAAYFKQTK